MFFIKHDTQQSVSNESSTNKIFYFMLIDEILIFISEIESVSVTDITHSVTDIGLSDYFYCLPSYFCTSCLPLLVTAGTRQQSS